MKSQILSVGIDIGTTTSQVIFSKLTIENKAAISRVPQINITDKEIIYRSQVYFTPLINYSQIDGEALAKIIQREYQMAHISPSDITVGAVIITGESSRKDNSREVVHALGELAGDFVVASAGPDLEGIIAGRGSGAAALSQEKRCIVANIDMGGGTSNIAIYDNGLPIDTACLDIGGRQILFDDGTLKIKYIAPKTKILCDRLGLSLKVGALASPSELDILCKKYTDLLAEILGFKTVSPELDIMLTDHVLSNCHQISYVIISGGVADAVYKNTSLEDPFQYNDIGIILGNTMKTYFPKPLIEGTETIRATVIGAGAFTASLSGSTIHVNREKLPLKNLPVIKIPSIGKDYSIPQLIQIIQQKIDWNWESSDKGFVLGFDFLEYLGYNDMQKIADIIITATEKIQDHNKILVIVIENDCAKALGQILQIKTSFSFLVLDSIKVHDGDYLDVGLPLHDETVVPVVVKSLIFNR